MTAPGDFNAGDVLAAADMNDLPAGVIDFVETTSSQGSITSVVDLTGLSITATLDSTRRYRITGKTSLYTDTTGDAMSVEITQGGTQIQEANSASVSGSAHQSTSTAWHAVVVAVIAGDDASTTYKLRGGRIIGSGTIATASTGVRPSFLLIEDIGPV